MKNIELTEDHKSKLLEMCKVLFSEWKNHHITENNYINDDTLYYSESDETFNIHWFEFCMTHLAKKVLKNNYFRLTAFSNDVLFRNRQPIDILYYEFKKLK